MEDELLDFVPPRRKPKKASEGGSEAVLGAASAKASEISSAKASETASVKPDLSRTMTKELEAAETTEWFVKMEPEEEKAKRLAREKNQPLVIAVVVLAFLIIAVGLIGYSLVESGFRF